MKTDEMKVSELWKYCKGMHLKAVWEGNKELEIQTGILRATLKRIEFTLKTIKEIENAKRN